MDKRIKKTPMVAYVTTDGMGFTGFTGDDAYKKASSHQLFLDRTSKIDAFEAFLESIFSGKEKRELEQELLEEEKSLNELRDLSSFLLDFYSLIGKEQWDAIRNYLHKERVDRACLDKENECKR